MNPEQIRSKAQRHLQTLCLEIADRSVGSEGNRRATMYFRDELLKNGWETEETILDVMDWKSDGATLRCGETHYEVYSSPYSLGCSVRAELISAGTIQELKDNDLSDKIVLLHGEVAKEQIMPKNFVFYNSVLLLIPENHFTSQCRKNRYLPRTPLTFLGLSNPLSHLPSAHPQRSLHTK